MSSDSPPHPRTPALPHRHGSVLIIVLVVVVLLALAAYNYGQLMLTEMEAASMHASDVQARAMCDSGAEYIATLIANRTQPGHENLQHNPQLFQGVLVVDSGHARGRGRFSIVAPIEQDISAGTVRYGLMDESAKINLNKLSKLFKSDQDAETKSRTMLMSLPGMTEDIADAILDWIDVDENSRQYGAEAEYYSSMGLPYSCKNGPLETIDELLLVRGVTPELLYGEDANRNGLLDLTENDGQASPPLDNADGILQHGWIAYFTVNSRELNLRSDGTPKINLNNPMLADIYDAISEELGAEAANFIIQYRLAGPVDPELPETDDGAGQTSSKSGGSSQSKSSGSGSGSSSGGSSRSGSSSGGSSSSGGKSGGSSGGNSIGGSNSSGSGKSSGQQSGNSAQNTASAAQALGNAAGQALGGGSPDSVTRNGYPLGGGGPNKMASVWAIFDSSAKKTPGAKGAPQFPELPSPFDSNDAQTVAKILDMFTTTDGDFIEGRINVNQARPEVLTGVPYMTPQLVEAITAAQQMANDPSSSVAASHATIGWLLSEGVVEDIQTLRGLDQYLTARGDVYRAQVLGFYDGGGPVARTEVVVDGTKQPPQIIFFRDLNDLGRGYTRAQLLTPVVQ